MPPTLIQAKYYARIPLRDVRPCSRCGEHPAVWLHTCWLVRWPTLCDHCYAKAVPQ